MIFQYPKQQIGYAAKLDVVLSFCNFTGIPKQNLLVLLHPYDAYTVFRWEVYQDYLSHENLVDKSITTRRGKRDLKTIHHLTLDLSDPLIGSTDVCTLRSTQKEILFDRHDRYYNELAAGFFPAEPGAFENQTILGFIGSKHFANNPKIHFQAMNHGVTLQF